MMGFYKKIESYITTIYPLRAFPTQVNKQAYFIDLFIIRLWKSYVGHHEESTEIATCMKALSLRPKLFFQFLLQCL